MKKLHLLFLLSILIPVSAFGIVNLTKPGVIWEVESGATAANVNGGGFDILNANFPTDFACASATGNNPICSSTTYGNFVAADNAAWIFIKQSTAHWTPGFYKLVDECVASAWAQGVGIGACTTGQGLLDATPGHAVQPYDVVTLGVTDAASTGFIYNAFVANTAAGVSDQASPTGGTFGIDYSQTTAARKNNTDGVCTIATPSVCTSSGSAFTVKDQGNILHLINAGNTHGLVGWYEIVSVSGANATVDRAATDGTQSGSVTFYMGGAVPLGSSTSNQTDVTFFQQGYALNGTGANHFFIKSGTYNLAASIASLTAGGTQTPIIVEGYNSLRGDTPTGANRPTLNAGSSYSITLANDWNIYNFIVTGSITSTNLLLLGISAKVVNVKAVDSTTTANRYAIYAGSNYVMVLNSEAVSYRGYALGFGTANGGIAEGSYFHDSDVCISTGGTAANQSIENNIFDSCVTAAISASNAISGLHIINNTLYGGGAGSGATWGIGVSLATGALSVTMLNNIIDGFTTGITHADTQTLGYGDYNDFYNNTANFSSGLQWQTQRHSLYVNPTFAGVTSYTGAGASTATTTLTDNGVDFTTYGIVNNRDFVNVTAGGTLTVGKYLITSVTDAHNIVLSPSPGTGTAVAYQITTGHNFAIGAASLKNGGFPGAFPAGLTTAYFGIGAAQPSGSGGSGQHNTGYVQ